MNIRQAIAKARRHTALEWDRLHGDLKYTLEVPKSAFVNLTFSHILHLLGMIAWGVGPCFPMCKSN
jgi:hypothetical protein